MSVFIYDITCFVVLLIILIDGKSKEYDFSQRVFTSFILTVQTFLLLDAFAWLCEDHLNPVTVNVEKVLMSIVFITQGVQGLFLMLYTEVYVWNKESFPKIYWIILSIQTAFSLVLVIANIFTGCIFTISPETHYVHGPLYNLNYLSYSPYIIISYYKTIKALIKAESAKDKKHAFYPFLTITIIVVAYILPEFTKGLNFVSAALTLSILVIYLNLQQKRMETIKIESIKNLEAKTFGKFDLLYKGESIKFKRTKSKEIIAYLIDRRGASVTMDQLCYTLWDDREYDESTKSLIRNLISDIKTTLKNYGAENFFVKDYNACSIIPDLISCDCYDLLDGKKNAAPFTGEYMSQYPWAEETAVYLKKL